MEEDMSLFDLISLFNFTLGSAYALTLVKLEIERDLFNEAERFIYFIGLLDRDVESRCVKRFIDIKKKSLSAISDDQLPPRTTAARPTR